jgi:hypothetical protein
MHPDLSGYIFDYFDEVDPGLLQTWDLLNEETFKRQIERMSLILKIK